MKSRFIIFATLFIFAMMMFIPQAMATEIIRGHSEEAVHEVGTPHTPSSRAAFSQATVPIPYDILTEREREFLDSLNYDNAIEITRYLSDHRIGIGNRRAHSFRADMAVDYIMDKFKSYGYEPYIHHFDNRNAAVGVSANPNNLYNHGYVEVGGKKYMYYGPNYNVNSAYKFTNNTTDITGAVVFPWNDTNGPFSADISGVSGKAVFVTLGDSPTQGAIAAAGPTTSDYYYASVNLQEAGAKAVIFQWREPRSHPVSPLPPYNGKPVSGDTTYSLITNMLGSFDMGGLVYDNYHLNIPVGTTHFIETNSILRSLNNNTAVKVDMRTRADGKNVVAVLPSATGSKKNIYITSHFDTVVSAPGFNDSGIGVGMALEMARVFKEKNMRFDHNIVFVMFDAEETGLRGARHFANDMTNEERANFVGLYNMDMIATGQPECIYMFMNIPDTDLREIQRTLSADERLITRPQAFAIASQYDVFNHSYLAVLKLDNDGRHKNKKIVVDPNNSLFGEFKLANHFNITWGSTTDNYAFAVAADTFNFPNMKNTMEFDWRILQRGLVGETLTFTGMLETLYHKAGDTYEENFSRDRLEVEGDIVALGVYQSARVLAETPVLKLTASPAGPQRLPLAFITLTATLEGALPSNSGQTIKFTVNGAEYSATTDANGVATYTIVRPNAGTYIIGASFGQVQAEPITYTIDDEGIGCNAGGYLALALMAAVPFIIRRKR